jgi:hypothetical protein
VRLSVCFWVVLSAVTSPALADEALVNKALSECLKVVHSMNPKDYPTAKQFDAYYNSVDGTVENNAMFGLLDRPVIFQFHKCMAQRGFPLGSPPKQ